jgi:hypothetical protein
MSAPDHFDDLAWCWWRFAATDIGPEERDISVLQ